jgi:hypothetical protein
MEVYNQEFYMEDLHIRFWVQKQVTSYFLGPYFGMTIVINSKNL